MSVVLDPDIDTVEKLLAALPPGGHGVDSSAKMSTFLANRPDTFLAVVGPHVPLEEALGLALDLRVSRPTVSILLVRSRVDTEVLTSAMHAGVRDVVTDGDTLALQAAAERAHQLYAALAGPSSKSRRGKIICVFSPKGGVGKTTMAVNLALALTESGARRVGLVDLDLAFGDVAITMQMFPTHTIEHAIGTEDHLDSVQLDSLLTRYERSLMVLAAPNQPDARDRISAALVGRVLHTMQENFDFVVVDCAPAFDEQTLTALDETDECVIVATLDVPTLKNVKVALDTLDMLEIVGEQRHLVLNRADDAVGISADKVEAILGMPVAHKISSSIDIAAATNAGRPIVLSNPEHASSRTFRALAARLAGDPDEQRAVRAAALGGKAAKPGRLFRRKK